MSECLGDARYTKSIYVLLSRFIVWSLLCYCVRDIDHCCVLCDVTRDLLLGISYTSLIECKSSVKNTWPLHYAPNTVNLERGGRAKAGDLTKKVRPRWGILITAKSRWWGLLNFLRLRSISWIGSCKIHGYPSVISCITRGIGNQRWRPLFPQGSAVYFLYACARRMWHRIYIYPLYSHSNEYIHSFTLLFPEISPRGTPHIKGMGMLVGNFESNP